MKTIKFIGKDHKLSNILLNGVEYKAYEIGDVPRFFKGERAYTWFNYKGYTYLLTS